MGNGPGILQPAEKLVRDRVPDIMRSRGCSVRVRIVTGVELDLMLRRKIVEEAYELEQSGDIEEIADLLEAVSRLLDIRGVSPAEIDQIREQKRKSRGGFDQGLVMSI
ncbi:MAG: nucleoside triphosphate pyrophosphohydrolase [Candidatus Thorarchaeota archaeon]